MSDNSPAPARPAANKTKRLSLAFFSAAIFLFFCAPVLVSVTNLIQDLPINGIALAAPPPRPSWSNLKNEQFQKAAERYALKMNGLWGWMVRSANQIYYSVFNQIAGGDSPSVVMGDNGHLFQPMYLRSFNRVKSAPEKFIETRYSRVKRLQDWLQARGKSLLVLISPNNIALYPELVPDGLIDPTRIQRKSSYQIARPLFDRLGINYLDTFEMFEAQKTSTPRRIFETTASHWNQPAACQVSSLILQRLQTNLGYPIPQLICGQQVTMQDPPPSADTDLVEIANLLFERQTYKPAPVVSVQALSPENARRPRLLFVGTSFLFAITDLVASNNCASPDSDFWFYFREQRKIGERSFHALDKRRLNLVQALSEYDAVILEANQASPGNIGYEFVETALRAIQPPKKAAAKK